MAHKLNSNALIDFETYIEFIGEDKDDTQLSKSQVNLYINMVSEFIEGYCDRLFRSATGLVELFDGDGEKDHYTRNIPINEATTAIKIEEWNGVSWEELTTSEATRAVQLEIGRIYFNDGTRFTDGEDNWRVTYDYGVTLKNIKSDVKQATCILVQRSMLKAEGKEGVEAESLVDRSVTINLSNIPQDVRRILDNNRNPAYGR